MAVDSPRHSGALVLMAKVPYPGTCKTRLCPPLSPREAARLYGCFLEDLARELAAWPADVDVVIAWTDDDRRQPDTPAATDQPPELLRALFEADRYTFLRQQGASLTDRMEHVFSTLFARGYARVVMRNSDSPHLPLRFLDDAFAALAARPGRVVLGPDLDGGYYLVGGDADMGGVFPRVMSTDSVLDQTLAGAEQAGRAVHLLPTFLDVDTPDDLAAFWLEFGGRADVRHWATWKELDGHPALERLGDLTG